MLYHQNNLAVLYVERSVYAAREKSLKFSCHYTVYDHSGDIGGLLTQGMKKVAEELGK
jgi:hypothetical protein